MTVTVIPLSLLLKGNDETKVSKILEGFKCSKDEDLEQFLKDRSIMYEKKSRSRTYLYMDMENSRVIAYISLALSYLKIDDDNSISNAYKKKMNLKDGLAPTYLLGQLAKDDSLKEQIGSAMVLGAIDMFGYGNEMFGCRSICVDCKNEPKLIDFYEKFGSE